MACVNVPALPLQVLLRDHPDWAAHPAAVVDRDKPQGTILWVNEAARNCRILPGMRYATGLALSRDLRAGVISEAAIAETVDAIAHALWCFSPRIEPATEEAGIFWLDASGLGRLYPSLREWAAQIRAELRAAEYYAVVAVGFTRFGSYAAAKAGRENCVFETLEAETAHMRQVAIARLGIAPALRDTLRKLGIRTLGGFVDLPAEGIRKRFGAEAQALHEALRGEGWTPLAPEVLLEPARFEAHLEHPETNLERVLIVLAPLLQEVLETFADRHEEVATLALDLTFDNGETRTERLAPAAPTRDARQLLALLRLRLDGLRFPAGIVELALEGEGAEVVQRQLALLHDAPRQNLAAVHEAFARVRAEFGNEAIVHARLHDAHLPEAQFTWEAMREPVIPAPEDCAFPPLIRRLYETPVELPARARNEPDGWMIARLADGPVEEVLGPHLIAGGWWMREVSRAYHYVRTRSGRWLWIYLDQKRKRWFVQGEVQ